MAQLETKIEKQSISISLKKDTVKRLNNQVEELNKENIDKKNITRSELIDSKLQHATTMEEALVQQKDLLDEYAAKSVVLPDALLDRLKKELTAKKGNKMTVTELVEVKLRQFEGLENENKNLNDKILAKNKEYEILTKRYNKSINDHKLEIQILNSQIPKKRWWQFWK